MLDQPFLACRLVEAGVACSPLPFHKINPQVMPLAMLVPTAVQHRTQSLITYLLTWLGSEPEHPEKEPNMDNAIS